jgi:hypothetical protein
MDDHRIGLRPHCQPAVVPAPHGYDHRRTLGDLVLELAGKAHSPRRLRLTIKDRQVHATRVDLGQDLSDRRGLDIAHPPDVRCRAPSNSVDDGLAYL